MLETIFLLFIAVLSIFLQIIIHEAGHLIFGVLTGYEFISFRIFSITILFQEKRLRISKNIISGTAGQCIMTPSFNESVSIPYFWYNAGGVISNLLTTIISLSTAFLFPEGNICRTVLIFLAIIGIIFTLYNGIPMKTRLVVNDAYNIYKLIHNPEAKRAFWRLLKLNEYQIKGIKLCNCPDEWFDSLQESYSNPIVCGWSIFVLLRFLERRNYVEALNICNKIIEAPNVPDIYKNEATCEKKFCEIMLFNAGTSSTTEFHYNLTKSNLKERVNQIINFHTQYAYQAVICNNQYEANNIISNFKKASLKCGNSGLLNFENTLLQDLSIISKAEHV